LGERVGLILMDISLAGDTDGLTLTRRIRADRRWRRVPIVVTTAHAFEQDRERAMAAGCDAYLAKPIDAGELLATISRLLVQPDDPVG
jgi:CheY-like chemotaxis protein